MSKLPLPSLPPSLRDMLSQPTSLALAASVGIHGLLFVLLPMLPSNSFEPEDNEQRTVDLVELTPSELSRLPDLSGPTTPSFPQLPNLDAEDPAQSDLFQIPNRSNRVPIFPNQSSQPFFIPPYPPAITIQPPVRSTTPPAQTQTEQEPATTSTSPAPEETTQEAPPVLGEARDLPELREFDVSELPEWTSPTPAEGEPTAEAEAEASQPSETLLAEQARLRQLFTFNEEGTSEDDGNLAFSTWFYDELGQQQTLPDEDQITLNADYNVTACRILGRIQDDPKRLSAIYGVVVDAEGALKDEPRLVRSSGFQYFNQQALEAIANAEFPNETGGDRIYLVDVVFEYSDEICPPAPSIPAEDDAPTG